MNKELKNIMSITIENLAKTQHDALKRHVINVLDTVKKCIEKEQYDQIEDLTFESPAGDGWGLDNQVIDFSYKDDENMDITEVAWLLNNLKTTMKRPKAKDDEI